MNRGISGLWRIATFRWIPGFFGCRTDRLKHFRLRLSEGDDSFLGGLGDIFLGGLGGLLVAKRASGLSLFDDGFLSSSTDIVSSSFACAFFMNSLCNSSNLF